MFKMFFDSIVKGIVMTLSMENGEEIKGQYEFTEPTFKSEPSVCLYTDRKVEYEYFPLKDIKSVLIKRAENES
jgi:hypothetical protein